MRALPGQGVFDAYLVAVGLLLIEGVGQARGAAPTALGALGLAPVAAAVGLAIELGRALVRRARAPSRRAVRFGLARACAALGVFALSAVLAESAAPAPEGGRPLLALGTRVIRALSPEAPPAPGPAPVAPPRQLVLEGWDVLLVTLHAARPDHFGASGYDRPTTPAMDALARGGVSFEMAYTASSRSGSAALAILGGDVGDDAGPPRAAQVSALARAAALPALFSSRGYATAALLPAPSESEDGEGIAVPAGTFTVERTADASCAARADDAVDLLRGRPESERVFLWVHCDRPRFPYAPEAAHGFGQRDLDRYDAQLLEADAAVGALVRGVRELRPRTLVIVTALSGEELGEHGGRRHGATVYEEQVRVPLILSAPGLLAPRRIASPVSTIDLLPTLARALASAPPPQAAGVDLGRVVLGEPDPAIDGRAVFAEVPEMSMLGRGAHRLVCLRHAASCALYDLEVDPRERRDAAGSMPGRLAELGAELERVRAARAGRARREPASTEEVLRRGEAGDGSVAEDAAKLLQASDDATRRRAAKALFEVARKETREPLRAALIAERDPETRAFIALALTRLGEGVPLVFELARGGDIPLRRLAALVLAEEGDARGEDDLIVWWLAAYPFDQKPVAAEDRLAPRRARDLMRAFGRLRTKEVVGSMIFALEDPELAVDAARALARIGEDVARPAMADRLARESSPRVQRALIEALLDLGGGPELRAPLVSLLGVPEPLPSALSYAIRADVLQHVGGPARESELRRMRRFASSGVLVDFLVPERSKRATEPPPGSARARVICRGAAPSGGQIRLGRRADLPTSSEKKAPIPATRPELSEAESVVLDLPVGDGATEVARDLPPEIPVKPGKPLSLVVYATQGVSLEACAIVPLRGPITAAP